MLYFIFINNIIKIDYWLLFYITSIFLLCSHTNQTLTLLGIWLSKVHFDEHICLKKELNCSTFLAVLFVLEFNSWVTHQKKLHSTSTDKKTVYLPTDIYTVKVFLQKIVWERWHFKKNQSFALLQEIRSLKFLQ